MAKLFIAFKGTIDLNYVYVMLTVCRLYCMPINCVQLIYMDNHIFFSESAETAQYCENKISYQLFQNNVTLREWMHHVTQNNSLFWKVRTRSKKASYMVEK